jgi:putative spermidine/putrescine transport system permease protein
LLVFLTALGFFITPTLLGGAKQTVIAEIIYQNVNQLLDWRGAGALSVVLMIATLLVFVAYDRLFGTGSLFGGLAAERAVVVGSGRDRGARISGAMQGVMNLLLDGLLVAERALRKAFRAGAKRAASREGRNLALGAWALIVIAFLVVPIALVIPMSLNGGSELTLPPASLSGRWYAAYLTDPEWMAATARSFEVALLTTVLATALGTSAAFALTRHRFRGSSAVTGLILAPMIVPRMVLAVAMFYTYSHLQLVGTTLGLVLAHTVLAIPYVVVTVCAALKAYDFRLDDAAATLGADRWKTFRYVTLPIIRGGVVSGALFAFITSFDDLNVALFVTGGLFTTLPKKMWDDMLLQVHPTLAVVSTLLVALISVVLIVVESTRTRGGGASAEA